MAETSANSTLKRRNSIPSAVVIPSPQPSTPPIIINGHHRLSRNHHSSPSPAADFELVSLRSPVASYTSLKDLLPPSPSSIMSPTPAASNAAVSTTSSAGSGYEISIRNRLVKQAAWAYLQPAVFSSPSSSSRRIFCSGQFLRPIIGGLRRFVAEMAIRVYDWLVDALWLILCR